MTEPTFIDLESLKGSHTLDTAPLWTTVGGKGDYYMSDRESDVMTIGIDGKTYIFTENPSDGYRSYMDKVEVIDGLDKKMLRGAAPIGRQVYITYDAGTDNYYGERNDLIMIYDMETGHLWGKLGTRNVNDYYPSCTMEWYPLDPETVEVKPAPKKIPIVAARAIADTYNYDQIVIYARRVGDVGGLEHMTTYGTNEVHCEVAGVMGKKLQEFMGWNIE